MRQFKWTHRRFGVSIGCKINPTPLPNDKRRKPYPAMRKMGMKNIKTWGDYNIALVKRAARALENRAQKVFNEEMFKETQVA